MYIMEEPNDISKAIWFACKLLGNVFCAMYVEPWMKKMLALLKYI